MNQESLARRVRNYLERQNACLAELEARLDAHAAGGLEWEAWFGHAGRDLKRIEQLAEEFALLRSEWEGEGAGLDPGLEGRIRETGERAAAAAQRFFAVIEEAGAEMDAIRAEMDLAARGKTMLRRYGGPGDTASPYLDTKI